MLAAATTVWVTAIRRTPDRSDGQGRIGHRA